MRTLDDWCAAALARPATQPAIEFERRWYGWGELARIATRVDELIEASGASRHARIALVARNHPYAIAALLGLLSKQRSVRMIYAFQSPTALAADIARVAPAVLIAGDADCSEPVLECLRPNGIAGLALSDSAARALPGLERARNAVTSAGDMETAARIEILTSGTTGPPKPFAIGFDLIAKYFLGGPDVDLSGAPPALLYFPLGNITGLYSTLPSLLRGQRAVLLERFTVAGWHDHLVRYRPEAGGLPPAGVQMVLDADLPKEDLACLRRLGTGAAPLDPNVHRAFEQRYGVPILLSYGATEFGGPVTAMTLELHAEWGKEKFGSVGRALPGAELRVIDPDTGTVLAAGSEGLLEVISPRIGPHWIRTSDIAVIDADGFVFLHGRNDGAIMRGGFKLLPETIERALTTHPSVAAAAVIAVRDARLGAVPGAAVQFRPGAEPVSAAQLESHVREQLPATHVPVHWRFVDELPRTPSFKVERPALRRMFDP